MLLFRREAQPGMALKPALQNTEEEFVAVHPEEHQPVAEEYRGAGENG